VKHTGSSGLKGLAAQTHGGGGGGGGGGRQNAGEAYRVQGRDPIIAD